MHKKPWKEEQNRALSRHTQVADKGGRSLFRHAGPRNKPEDDPASSHGASAP